MNLPAVFKRSQEVERDAPLVSLDDYIAYVTQFIYNGSGYTTGLFNQTAPGQTQEQIGYAYRSLSELAYKSDGVVFACMLTRALHFSEVRFQWRNVSNGRPGKLFGNQDLAPLESPWQGGTTGDLLTRMIQHADLAGNAFVVKTESGGLALLRPDWVTIVAGSDKPPNDFGMWDPDAQVVGYVYSPGGPGSGMDRRAFLPEEVAHFAPIPDPEARFRGMSWLTPLIREVMADKAATEHKLRFFENPTPNMVVKFDVPDLDEFREQISAFKQAHTGVQNAFKYMFGTMGMDFTPVGSNLKDLDYKLITGAGETRIAAAARTPPVIVGLSEGLQGSALNSGNYQAARRMFADGCIRPLWRNAAGSLSSILTVPSAAELWYDERDVAFLKEDLKERAGVAFLRAQTIRQLVDAGFDPQAVVDSVDADDISKLEHSGLFSVQLQAANAPKQGLFQGTPVPTAADQAVQPAAAAANGNGNGNSNGRSVDALEELLRLTRPEPGDTHVHFEEGAFQLPAAPSQDVHIHEGAVRAEFEVPETRIEVNVPERETHVTVEAAEAPRVEFAAGAFRTEVAAAPTPDVNVTVEAPPPTETRVEFAERSIVVEPANVDVRVEPPPPAEVNVSVTPELRTELSLSEDTVDALRAGGVPDVVVNVDPTPVTVENVVNVPETPVNVNLTSEPVDATIEFKRRRDGQIESAKLTEADGGE